MERVKAMAGIAHISLAKLAFKKPGKIIHEYILTSSSINKKIGN